VAILTASIFTSSSDFTHVISFWTATEQVIVWTASEWVMVFAVSRLPDETTFEVRVTQEPSLLTFAAEARDVVTTGH